MEDVDLGDRLGKAGWLNVFVPTAQVHHDQGHAANKHPERMLEAHHASAYRFQADRHPHWYQAPIRWILWFGLQIRVRIEITLALRKQSKNAGKDDN
jgi:N-acetylglucosaminyl-diphospho-decaprenol L-rhamnosyltransferase